MPLLYHLQAPSRHVPITPLTSESFAPYGKVLQSPFPSSPTLPETPPPNAQSANQGTALKFPHLTDLSNYYALHGTTSATPAAPTMSMFLCAPRSLRANRFFDVRVLERHPYTSQTFVPLGMGTGSAEDRRYLVVVAPNLATSMGLVGEGHMPDLARVRAFAATGDQAVTYARGTWHAPMVVLGGSSIPFVVVQWASGVPVEDCEECAVGEGLSVVVGGSSL